MNETTERKSLLAYGMEGGLWLGLYLVLRFICSVAGSFSPIFDALALMMFVGTPFVLYYIMLRYHRNNGFVSGFSLLWMMGIMLFFFASLICAVPEFIFYQYIDPDYIANAMTQSLKLIEDMGLMKDDEAYNQMRQLIEQGTAPTAIQMIMSSMWSNVFFGSLLSIVVAPFVTRKKYKA